MPDLRRLLLIVSLVLLGSGARKSSNKSIWGRCGPGEQSKTPTTKDTKGHEGVWPFLLNAGSSALLAYCFASSTRRFLALPSSVELSATGLDCPKPCAVRRLAATP